MIDKQQSPTGAHWRELLKRAVAERGTSAVARALEYSPAVVSQTLKGQYAGRVDRVATRVMEVFGQEEVDCPVLGTIARERCGRIRRSDFRATNPTRIQLWTTCPTCPNNPDAGR